MEARRRLNELCAGAWALAVAAAEVEGGIPPELRERADDVLRAAGLEGLESDPHTVADLRATLLQVADFAARAREGTLAPGWAHTDPVLLQAQGDMSAGAVGLLADGLFPSLGVEVRDFLDVGTGVAAVPIGLCRRLPDLRCVGIEPQDAPLALAHRNVAEAGLRDRIELRRQLVQDLTDEAAFDVVWLPLMFLPPDVAAPALAAVHRALRPGGAVITGSLVNEGDDLESAAARLRAALWGGAQTPPDVIETLAREAGYADVRRRPKLGSGLTPMLLIR